MTHKHTYSCKDQDIAKQRHSPPHSQIPTHVHTCICPNTHTLTRSDTPEHIICTGRGTASDGVKRWTAFEPATSVTHPYWWQAVHSLTTQRFSKHSIAPGTAGVNGGKGGGRGGWMGGGVDRQVKNIASQVYFSRCDGGTTKRQWETLTYSMLCPVGRFSEWC